MQVQNVDSITFEQFEKRFFPQYHDERIRERDYDRAEEAGSKEIATRVKTLEGVMRGNFMDFIIRGVNGEVYPNI